MDDTAFLAAFEDTTLPEEEFTHRNHLRMAWLVLRQDGRERGTARILESLRRFVVAKGAATKFHVTLTLFWVHVVDTARRERPELEGFDAFMAAHPHLADSRLPFRYYDRDHLMGDAARGGWVEPELAPLP